MSVSPEELERLLREAATIERPPELKGERVNTLELVDKTLIFEGFLELESTIGKGTYLLVQAVDVAAKKRVVFSTGARFICEDLKRARSEGRWPLKARIVRKGRALLLRSPEM